MSQNNAGVQRINLWRELAGVQVLVMDISWAVVWYRMMARVGAEVSPLKAVSIIGIFGLLTYAWVRLGAVLRLRANLIQGGVFGALVLGGFWGFPRLLPAIEQGSLNQLLNHPVNSLADITGILPPEVVVAFTLLLVWWRATHLAQTRVGHLIVFRQFRIGTAMFILWGAFSPTLTGGLSGAWLFVLFVVSALVGLTAGRVAVLGALRGGRENPFNRRWFGALSGLALGIVAVSGGVARFFADNLLEPVNLLLVRIFQGAVILVTAPLAALLLLIAPWLEGKLVSAPQPLPPVGTVTPTPNAAAQLADQISQMASQPAAPMPWLALLKPLLIWGGVIVLVIFVLRAAGEQRRGLFQPDGLAEEYEDLSRSDRLPGLRKLWQNLTQPVADSRLGSLARRRAAARVRAIYADLTRLAGRLGVPRPAAATPLEYLPILSALFDSDYPALETITQAYLRVRYGEFPETREQVETVEAAWKILQAHGAQLRRQKKGNSQK